LHREAEWHGDKGHRIKTLNFENSRRRTAGILHVVKFGIFQRNKRPISMVFGIQMQISNLMTVTWPNVTIFKIQGGGRPPF